MYKARHAKPTKHRVTLPMLVLIAALCVAILVFPTTASGETTTPDAVSGMRRRAVTVRGKRDVQHCSIHTERRERDTVRI